LLLVSSTTSVAAPAIIPWPVKAISASGTFTVDERTPICAATDAERAVAAQLQAVVKAVQGLDLTARDCKHGGISVARSSTAAVSDEEGYTLDVSAQGIRIEARAAAGLYYGAVTLAQLLSAGSHGGPVKPGGIHIEDYPRFKWRGLMLDPARHFFAVADVKMMLDQMGQHKLNVLHLHLTDDQGWRIEIQRYPELTKIGAWRTPPSNGRAEEASSYGGFYTQQDIREIVRYAAARHITIVPEIDLPGHAQAVVAAHPKLSVLGDQPKVSNNWGVNDYLYNTDEYSLAFLKNVLDEIMRLFPGKYIHLGGDEAIKDQWQASPAVQAQRRALGLASNDELQNWFMQQLGRYLAEHGRIMVGWDEILDGAVPSNATVMSWRGTQGAITAARLGHDVVMSPAPALYFDNLQSARDDEPAGRLGVVPLPLVYNFEVMPAVLSADERRHVLGAQANLWSEYLPSSWYLQHATFPRMDALSEAVWSPPSRMSWSGFLARLPAQIQRYQRQGIAVADSAFAVDFQLVNGRNAALQTGTGALALINQTSFGEIRYTLDGSVPSLQSTLYTSPLIVKLGAVIKATAFSDDGLALAAARTYNFNADTLSTRSSNQLHACPGNALGLRLPLMPDSPAVAPVFNVNLLNSCYIQAKTSLTDVRALKVDIARLPRNFGLANRKNQMKSYPARTAFGELVVHQDRCETGPEIARAALADPAASDNRRSLDLPIAPTSGEHDVCFIFTAPTSGPLYAIDRVTLIR
ncbi:MAG: family 20 glycosylhydrolase, partial [Pseudomonadota bacterium]|nr:family 20 glycosylhydrolase [Pseudomonadota bacterium]